MYNPHPQLSVDESIIGTKCRLSFIQYLPAKPTKWGLYVQMVLQDIFIHNEVYCGANNHRNKINVDYHLYNIYLPNRQSGVCMCRWCYRIYLYIMKYIVVLTI